MPKPKQHKLSQHQRRPRAWESLPAPSGLARKRPRLRVLHLSRNRNPNPRLPTRTVTGNLRRRP
ncbi:hypothetical protein I552_7543 [Mycobacterium xenopi 3993]|nr:hypothetical protein I552_7543 [Mycobacterium xenopi 3993]